MAGFIYHCLGKKWVDLWKKKRVRVIRTPITQLLINMDPICLLQLKHSLCAESVEYGKLQKDARNTVSSCTWIFKNRSFEINKYFRKQIVMSFDLSESRS